MAASQVFYNLPIRFFLQLQPASNGLPLAARSGVSHCQGPRSRSIAADTDPFLYFLATRATILHNFYPSPSQKDRLTASTFAGGVTGGTIGGLFRGPRNVIPGTIMFTLFGYLGQTVYEALDTRHSEQVVLDIQAAAEGKKRDRKHFWERIAEMKWSPLTAVSDEDYRNMLEEKLLSIEAEITVVDEEVERVKGEERRMKERQSKKPPKPTT